jgi:hypothetical protein
MHSKLTSKVDEETGMKIGLVGFLVAMIGLTLAFTIFPRGGYWLGVSGALLGLLGGVTHFVKNWRSIFHVHRE